MMVLKMYEVFMMISDRYNINNQNHYDYADFDYRGVKFSISNMIKFIVLTLRVYKKVITFTYSLR